MTSKDSLLTTWSIDPGMVRSFSISLAAICPRRKLKTPESIFCLRSFSRSSSARVRYLVLPLRLGPSFKEIGYNFVYNWCVKGISYRCQLLDPPGRVSVLLCPRHPDSLQSFFVRNRVLILPTTPIMLQSFARRAFSKKSPTSKPENSTESIESDANSSSKLDEPQASSSTQDVEPFRDRTEAKPRVAVHPRVHPVHAQRARFRDTTPAQQK